MTTRPKMFRTLGSCLGSFLLFFHTILVLLICVVGIFERYLPQWLGIFGMIIFSSVLKLDFVAVMVIEPRIAPLIDSEVGFMLVTGFWLLLLGGGQWYLIGLGSERFFGLLRKRKGANED